MGILDLPPGSAILGWPAANYVNPETRGSGAVIGCLFLTAVCMFVLVARIWARAAKSKNLGIDDWVMMAALVCGWARFAWFAKRVKLTLEKLPTLGLVANAYLAIKEYDFDRHLWDIKASNFSAMLKVTFADELLYTLASGLVKISILTYFLRFASASMPPSYKYMTWATIVFVLCHMLIFTEELFLSCVPFSETFEVHAADQDRQCVSGGVWAGVRNGLSLVQDFIPALLAVLMSWKMEVHPHQKFAVMAVLAMGFGVCFVGIVRVGYFSSIYFTSWDWSWLGGQAFTWSAVECLLGMICASLPALSVYIYGPPTTHGPITTPDFKDPAWRKFSMNESGRKNNKNGSVSVSAKEVGVLEGLASSRNVNGGYGGRRRSRVPSMAPIVGEKDM